MHKTLRDVATSSAEFCWLGSEIQDVAKRFRRALEKLAYIIMKIKILKYLLDAFPLGVHTKQRVI